MPRLSRAWFAMNAFCITTGSITAATRVRSPESEHVTPKTQGTVVTPSRSANSHRGFTLIEMLVSIAIMAVIFSMMLPAIQSARESARMTYCRSNLAQLGEAFHAYHQTHGSLPSGSIDSRSPVVAGPDRFAWGWALQLLPQLGEQNRAARLNPTLGVTDPINSAILQQSPTYLICPSSGSPTPIGYAGCHNDQLAPIQLENNGVLTLNSRVRYEELVDGLHQTLLLGEAADVLWAEGTYGSLRNIGTSYGEAYALIYVGTTPEAAAEQTKALQEQIRMEQKTSLPETDDDTEDLSEGESSLSDEEISVVLPSPPQAGQQPPQPPVAEPLDPSHRKTGFWPAHRGSGHFLLADGSVRVVSRSVSLEVLRRLANRNDHQTIEEF
jgi:prepilin-type N-terminal cleavage/methylation domain-containing protein